MSESGLAAVSNPSEIFLSDNFPDSDVLAGLAIAVVVDGSRTFLIEIQVCLIIGTKNGKEHYWNLVVLFCGHFGCCYIRQCKNVALFLR